MSAPGRRGRRCCRSSSELEAAQAAASLGVFSSASLVANVQPDRRRDRSGRFRRHRSRLAAAPRLCRARTSPHRMEAMRQLWQDGDGPVGLNMPAGSSPPPPPPHSRRRPSMQGDAVEPDRLDAFGRLRLQRARAGRQVVERHGRGARAYAPGRCWRSERRSDDVDTRPSRRLPRRRRQRRPAPLEDAGGRAGRGSAASTSDDGSRSRRGSWASIFERTTAGPSCSSAPSSGASPAPSLCSPAIGMQTGDWRGVPPDHLYRILSALRRVGLGYEARMIAAEAMARL